MESGTLRPGEDSFGNVLHMLSLDGPEHERHRSPFAAAFRPGEVSRRYGDLVPRTARRLVTDLEPRGTAELRR